MGFTKLYLDLLGYWWFLMGSIRFYRASPGGYWVLCGCTGFSLVFIGCYWVSTGSGGVRNEHARERWATSTTTTTTTTTSRVPSESHRLIGARPAPLSPMGELSPPPSQNGE